MPRRTKKTTGFTWLGKPVSKTTFFRHQAAARASNDLEKAMAAAPRGEASAPKQGETPVPNTEPKAPTIGEQVDDALLRDFMTAIRNPQRPPLRFDATVALAPRVFLAVLRALEKAGY